MTNSINIWIIEDDQDAAESLRDVISLNFPSDIATITIIPSIPELILMIRKNKPVDFAIIDNMLGKDSLHGHMLNFDISKFLNRTPWILLSGDIPIKLHIDAKANKCLRIDSKTADPRLIAQEIDIALSDLGSMLHIIDQELIPILTETDKKIYAYFRFNNWTISIEKYNFAHFSSDEQFRKALSRFKKKAENVGLTFCKKNKSLATLCLKHDDYTHTKLVHSLAPSTEHFK